AIPRALSAVTNGGSKIPMIDDTTRGAAASTAAHCAAKSGGLASPASGLTSGPQLDRKRRTLPSASSSRGGGGSGTHKLSWKPPLLSRRKASAQATIPSGRVNKAPMAPIPPALATAALSPVGHAPAIGASRIGSSSP